MTREEFLLPVVTEASLPGVSAEPSQALAALAGHADALAALLAHQVDLNSVFEEMRAAYGTFPDGAWRGTPMPDDLHARWVPLVRWVLSELSAWDKGNDPLRQRLAMLFVAGEFCAPYAKLWAMLPGTAAPNNALLSEVTEFVAGSAITFSEVPGAPIWEREAILGFQKAEAEKNWPLVAVKWHLFEPASRPNLLQIQAVSLLNRYARGQLYKALENIRQILVVSLMADALPIDDRLAIAAASDNPYLQFGFVFCSVRAPFGAATLSADADAHLTALLVKVSSDINNWKNWMRAFGAMPAWYPALQGALGRALAVIDAPAIEVYVATLKLDPCKLDDPNRQAVSSCLGGFRMAAPLDRRQALWKLTHERWRTWGFDTASLGGHLVAMMQSTIDYALVGFAIECMTAAERDEALQDIRNRIERLELDWHATESDCLTAFNRLLFVFQPFARASEIAGSADHWAATDRIIFRSIPRGTVICGGCIGYAKGRLASACAPHNGD